MNVLDQGDLRAACRRVYELAGVDFMLPSTIQAATGHVGPPGRTHIFPVRAGELRFRVELDRPRAGAGGGPGLPLRFEVALGTPDGALHDLAGDDRRELVRAFLLGARAPILTQMAANEPQYLVTLQLAQRFFLPCGILPASERSAAEDVCAAVGRALYLRSAALFGSAETGVAVWAARAGQDLMGQARPDATELWPEPQDQPAIERNRPIAEKLIDSNSVELALREKPASKLSQRALTQPRPAIPALDRLVPARDPRPARRIALAGAVAAGLAVFAGMTQLIEAGAEATRSSTAASVVDVGPVVVRAAVAHTAAPVGTAPTASEAPPAPGGEIAPAPALSPEPTAGSVPFAPAEPAPVRLAAATPETSVPAQMDSGPVTPSKPTAAVRNPPRSATAKAGKRSASPLEFARRTMASLSGALGRMKPATYQVSSFTQGRPGI